jgi:hypothetical protein
LLGRKAAKRAQKFLCRISGAQLFFSFPSAALGLTSGCASGASIIGAKEIEYAERF